MTRNQFRALAALTALLAVALVAVPVFGVDPSGSPSSDPSDGPASAEPSAVPAASADAERSPEASAATASPPASAQPEASAKPEENEQGQGEGQKPDKADKAAKADKAPEQPVTVTGIVGRSADDENGYSLTSGLNIFELSAGPAWWWGDANPLEDFVGSIVTIDGEQAEGSDEIDVLKVNGNAIRAAGRPPWAGGWKVVGEKHPGWAQWKVDKLAGHGFGRDTAPGQLRKGAAAPSPAP
jgi:hypothetical protein